MASHTCPQCVSTCWEEFGLWGAKANIFLSVPGGAPRWGQFLVRGWPWELEAQGQHFSPPLSNQCGGRNSLLTGVWEEVA